MSFFKPQNIIDTSSKKSNSSKKSFFGVQPKLNVGESNDKYEKEADAVADRVVQKKGLFGAEPFFPPAPKYVIQRLEARENEMQKKEETEQIQEKPIRETITPLVQRQVADEIQEKESAHVVQPSSNVTQGATSKIETKLSNSKGGGRTMDSSTKDEMEAGFGTDFSDVKIHNDSNAVQMNKELGSQAFANGNDIYFNEGKYNPLSKDGQHLLAHELTHTVQQKGADINIQRAIEPEQVSQEMIGKGFTIDQEVIVKFDSGKIIFPKWQFVKILQWENSSNRVRVTAHHKGKNKKFTFSILKNWITPFAKKDPGLYKYNAGLNNVKSNIASGQKAIDNWKASKNQYEKHGTMQIYNAQLQNLERRQAIRYIDLNRKLIQEKMYNFFDTSIKKWTDYYNKSIGKVKGWDNLDANIMKSLIFQESQMGTAGVHLMLNPAPGSVKTRYKFDTKYR